MKKIDFEKLGEFIVEYSTYMDTDTATPLYAYMNPGAYPYFRRMCDLIITDTFTAYDEYSGGADDHEYMHVDGLIRTVVCEEIECVDKRIYDTCIEYARLARSFVLNSFKLRVL